MRKQIIVTGTILMGLAFMFTGNAWAERERPGGNRDDQHLRDRGDQRSNRGVKPDRNRQWRGRDKHHDRPGGRWAPEKRHHVRKRHDRRWQHPKPHAGQRHRWQSPRKHHRGPQWRPGRHHRPRHFHRPWHPRRGHARRHAWLPLIEKHVHHNYDQAASEPAAAEQFEIAASINDPAGGSFSFGISGTN